MLNASATFTMDAEWGERAAAGRASGWSTTGSAVEDPAAQRPHPGRERGTTLHFAIAFPLRPGVTGRQVGRAFRGTDERALESVIAGELVDVQGLISRADQRQRGELRRSWALRDGVLLQPAQPTRHVPPSLSRGGAAAAGACRRDLSELDRRWAGGARFAGLRLRPCHPTKDNRKINARCCARSARAESPAAARRRSRTCRGASTTSCCNGTSAASLPTATLRTSRHL